MLVPVLPVAAAVLVPVELDRHLGDVCEVALFEERVPGRGGLEVALQALAVREVGAPLHQLGAGAAALVGRVRVEDVEHCRAQMAIG